MSSRKLAQSPRAQCRQAQMDESLIRKVSAPLDEFRGDRAINQPDDAVMAQ